MFLLPGRFHGCLRMVEPRNRSVREEFLEGWDFEALKPQVLGQCDEGKKWTI